MSLNINSASQNNQNAFRGKYARTENGTPYYKTNSGATAGAVLAVPAAAMWLYNLGLPTEENASKKSMDFMEKAIEKFSKNLPESEKNEYKAIMEEQKKVVSEQLKKELKRNSIRKKTAIPAALVAVACSIGCGAAIDNLRNQKARETADLVRQIGDKRALMQGENTAMNNRGKVYYESNQGSKWGALLGAGCGIIHSFMNLNKGVKGIVIPALTFALGGWLMGSIADKNANKAARRH